MSFLWATSPRFLSFPRYSWFARKKRRDRRDRRWRKRKKTVFPCSTTSRFCPGKKNRGGMSDYWREWWNIHVPISSTPSKLYSPRYQVEGDREKHNENWQLRVSLVSACLALPGPISCLGYMSTSPTAAKTQGRSSVLCNFTLSSPGQSLKGTAYFYDGVETQRDPPSLWMGRRDPYLTKKIMIY
jgi:hypothetical protein